jgi:hypothetical protein
MRNVSEYELEGLGEIMSNRLRILLSKSLSASEESLVPSEEGIASSLAVRLEGFVMHIDWD